MGVLHDHCDFSVKAKETYMATEKEVGDTNKEKLDERVTSKKVGPFHYTKHSKVTNRMLCKDISTLGNPVEPYVTTIWASSQSLQAKSLSAHIKSAIFS